MGMGMGMVWKGKARGEGTNKEVGGKDEGNRVPTALGGDHDNLRRHQIH